MITIGIPTALYNGVFGINAKYVDFISQFGKPKLLTPHEDNEGIDPQVDMIFLPGGADTDGNNGTNYLQQRSNPHLEWFDKNCLPQYIENNYPIFAVCRGIGVINRYFGGTLKNIIGHNFNKSEDEKCKLTHKVGLSRTEMRNNDLDVPSGISVNSIHHMAIDHIGSGLQVIGVDPNDEQEVIEVIQHVHYPIFGVQWHPEKIHDNLSYQIMKKLKTYAGRREEQPV